jgi:hypothetical protein
MRNMTMSKKLLAAVAALMASAVTAGPASADFGFETFTATTTTTQAGAHPDSTVDFRFNSHFDANNKPTPDGHVKDVVTSLPAGMIGNPQAVPSCAPALLNQNACPAKTQIGQATVTTIAGPFTQGVYNLDAPAGVPGQFGFNVLGIAPVYIRVTLRSDGDYGLDTNLASLAETLPALGTTLTLWGVPADHNGSGQPRVPFMTNPTQCSLPLTTTVQARQWGSTDWVATSATQDPPTGCDQLSVAPQLTVTPETARADTPSGYRVDLIVPQNTDPDGIATPTARRIAVTLPQGTSLNPAAADGLHACTDAQLGLGTLGVAQCPDGSKVGTVELASPLTAAPMEGAVYLLAGTAADPFRIGVEAAGHGALVKLAGSVETDPTTGQMTTVFDNQPQVPFSRLSIAFKGGGRALLANAAHCGPQASSVAVTPWGGAPATASTSFAIEGADCALTAFAPSLTAGSLSSIAAADTAFTMTLARGDGQPALSGLHVSLPPGLTSRLDAVPACPVAAATAGTCSEDSRIGNVDVAAGAGPSPVHIPGRVYLTQGDAGSVAGLSMVIPDRVGPFDLGTTVLRARISLRQSDFGLDVDSDPLPQVVGGVPLHIRSVGVDLDRPGFMINPTSCAVLPVSGAFTADNGEVATATDRFQVGGCDRLAFAPKVSVKAGGKGHTAKGRATPLTVTITQKPGEARLRTTSVQLPPAFAPRPQALQRVCSPGDLAANRCPVSAVVGRATATTPLLAQPISGAVYLVASPSGLPRLAVRIRGRIPLDLEGLLAINTAGRLTTTFAHLPDLPITKFVLELTDKNAAPLAVAHDLCTSPQAHVRARETSQAGHATAKTVPVVVSGCTKAKK